MYVCVALRETSVKASYACRPSRDRTEIYFLTPTNRKTCKRVYVCVCLYKHINTHEIFYTHRHTHLVLGAKNYKIGDEVRCETVCVYASLYSMCMCVCTKLRFSVRCLILGKDTDR